MTADKRVGFWDPRRNPQVEALMPWDDATLEGKRPKENSTTLTDEQQAALLQKLRQIEKRASSLASFGASWCRVCGVTNGSLEYSMDGWTWPQGYGHYIESHSIEMDPAFRDWLNQQPHQVVTI